MWTTTHAEDLKTMCNENGECVRVKFVLFSLKVKLVNVCAIIYSVLADISFVCPAPIHLNGLAYICGEHRVATSLYKRERREG